MKFLLTDYELEKIKQDAQREALKEYSESEETQRKNIEWSISQRGECAVYFNFNDPNLVVFSVERVDHHTMGERTIIGYYLKAEAIKDGAEEKKAIKEWALYCNRQQHNELVKKFNESTSKQLLKG